MQSARPYVLTIAGFDPSCGAGLTADIKTFEQMKVYGLALCSGLTLQTEDEFLKVSWRGVDEVKTELELLLKKYPVKAVKFGIVPSFEFLNELILSIKKKDQSIKIVVDPVWKASTGLMLNTGQIVLDKTILEQITLFTPNVPEFEFMSNGKTKQDFLNAILPFTNLLLKGGHSTENKGVDILYTKNEITEIAATAKTIYPKHGSGCVLSAAIAAKLASGKDLKEACISGKTYIENFLTTNKSLLGYHAA